MKVNKFKSIFFLGFLFFLAACSTKKNTFLARNSHALSTKYNILYNGQIALNKGLEEISADNNDNFWKRLPIEKMQINNDLDVKEPSKNKNFELAEAKATKAIQKHSMNIGGSEKNTQMDEAYLLLGKSRYYDQRYVPALDAFNYILYKYSNSDKIYEAKIWREKTNMRMGNDALVVKNINRLQENNTLTKQVFANSNALLAEAYLNLDDKYCALEKLKEAEKATKINVERARYRFILGQLYAELGNKDSAVYCFQSVIEMKRKAPREFVIQAHAKKAQLFDYQKGDTTAFLKTHNKLIKDRENRPFLDVIFHQMGVFYDKTGNQKRAFNFYNASIKKATSDQYLVASNYRNLGDINFRKSDYSEAAKYYDSTLVKLNPKTREFIHIKKTRKDLDEVILYEDIAKRNDSIINVVSMSETDRISYFENYIDRLKKEDATKKILEEKQKTILENQKSNGQMDSQDPNFSTNESGIPKKKSIISPPSIANTASTFYFYNPTTVSFGKIKFKKMWGGRPLKENWRLTSNQTNISINEDVKIEIGNDENIVEAEKPNEKYSTDYYINQLPQMQTEIDSINKERNFVYYQLGIIYKEKLKEYELASNKLEQLLAQSPEEKLILPALYNLYKIYQINNNEKAEAIKKQIAAQYPESRYSQIINDTASNEISIDETPESIYNKYYKMYQEQQFNTVLEKTDLLINQFSGDEIVSKFELLRANTIGKLKGLADYKKALQNVVDNYPNSEEGKNAQEILANQIPYLEKLDFNEKDTKNWKILYKTNPQEDKKAIAIEEKIRNFIADKKNNALFYSCDAYLESENFITIHGIKSKDAALEIASALKENTKYKISEPAIVVTNENYKVIQINKNLKKYLTPAPIEVLKSIPVPEPKKP